MKLYGVVGSNNSRKVMAAINHLGIDVEIEYLDFFEGDLGTPQYLSINPNGRVPTLEDGDFHLWESNAIMQYLADQVPGNSLFPKDEKTRSAIVQWQCWELAHYNQAFGVLAWEAVAKPSYLGLETDHAVAEWAKAGLKQHASILEAHLKDREYVVGDDITLADYSMVHVEWFKDMVPFDWSEYPNVNAYYDRLRAVPHWAQTAPPSPQAVGRRPRATLG